MAASTMIASASPRANARVRSGTDRWKTSVHKHSTTVPEAPATASGPAAAIALGRAPDTASPAPETTSAPRIRSSVPSNGAASAPNPNAAVAIPKPPFPASQCWWLNVSRPIEAALSTRLPRATKPIATATPGARNTVRNRPTAGALPTTDPAGACTPRSSGQAARARTALSTTDQRPPDSPSSTPPTARSDHEGGNLDGDQQLGQ